MARKLSSRAAEAVGRPGWKTTWKSGSNTARQTVRRLYERDPAKGRTAHIGTRKDAVKANNLPGLDLAGNQRPTRIIRALTAPFTGTGNARRKAVKNRSKSSRITVR